MDVSPVLPGSASGADVASAQYREGRAASTAFRCYARGWVCWAFLVLDGPIPVSVVSAGQVRGSADPDWLSHPGIGWRGLTSGGSAWTAVLFLGSL